MVNLFETIFSSPLFFFLIIAIILFNIRIYKKESKTILISFMSLIGLIFLFSGKLFVFINSIYCLITVLFITGFLILRDAFNNKYQKVNITFFSILSLLFVLSLNEYLSISLFFEIIWLLYEIIYKAINYYVKVREDRIELENILASRHYDGPVIDEEYHEPKKETILNRVNNYLDNFIEVVTPVKEEKVYDEIEPTITINDVDVNELYLEKELSDNSPTSYVEIENVRKEFNTESLNNTYEVKEEKNHSKEEIIISDDLDLNDLYELKKQILELKKNKA